MFEWIKFTFGSYYSNKSSKEGAKRSFWNVIFALFIMFIILTAFLSTGFNYSFSTHYNNSSKYQEFLHNAFTLQDEDKRVNLIVNERTNEDKVEKYVSAFYGNDSTKEVLINTFENSNDISYSKNGYNLIVDTRSSYDTYYEFDIDVYKIDNKEEKISFAEYKALPSVDQANYVCDLQNPIIKNQAIDLTDDLVATYRNYIETTYVPTLSDKDEMLTLWNQIKDVTSTDPKYKNYIYEYYLKAYVGLSFAPNNQYYYQLKYAAYDDQYNFVYNDYLIITDTWCLASFVTDKGVRVTYDGYYDSLSNGFVISTPSLDNAYVKDNVNTFVLASYSSVNSLRTILIGMQVIRYFPTIIITMAILALLIFCFCKLKKLEYGFKYVGAFKVVSSYLIMSSAVSGIITLILAFFTSNQVALSVGLWALLGLLSIRVFVLVICDWIKVKKDPVYVSSNDASVIDLENEDNEEKVDLSKVETGTIIIVNDDEDDDDLEKMELM